MDAASVMAVIIAVVFTAVLVGRFGSSVTFSYGLLHMAAVPSDSAFGDWREDPSHPNWHREKQFKRNFWSGVGGAVMVIAIGLVWIFN
jgi:hypothetical protein